MKLLHLYYDLMNLYGEYANMAVLASRLKGQGLEITVTAKPWEMLLTVLNMILFISAQAWKAVKRRPSRIFSPTAESLPPP